MVRDDATCEVVCQASCSDATPSTMQAEPSRGERFIAVACVDAATLRAAQAEDREVIMARVGSGVVVLGCVGGWPSTAAPTCACRGAKATGSTGGLATPFEVHADDERVSLTARNEISIRCGRASITLTRAGKVLIKGAYVLSRSTGANRIKGGSVQIN
ncbi:MAG: hypothetical protein SFZ23_14995 [Planctomycetota bacterium]|nr:hypothetical protein [Planctomycetota bacterium]